MCLHFDIRLQSPQILISDRTGLKNTSYDLDLLGLSQEEEVIVFSVKNFIDNLNVHILDESFSERDLVVQMKYNLKWDDQCKIAAMRGNTALATIHKTFKSMDVKMLSSLYKTY
ncbi:hypothetical protein BpHYR1_040357, partial [Brachionus plicatilis]